MQTVDALKSTDQTNFQWLQQWSEERPIPRQTVGLLALAGATGMVVGVIAAKGIVATKGVSAVGAGLAQKSATMQSAGSVLTGATTLSAKATALFSLLTHNALPITAGAVGGGVAGVGVMQGQVRRVQERLDGQVAQTIAAQAEISQRQSQLASAPAPARPEALLATEKIRVEYMLRAIQQAADADRPAFYRVLNALSNPPQHVEPADVLSVVSNNRQLATVS